jgi:hypothetical protein
MPQCQQQAAIAQFEFPPVREVIQRLAQPSAQNVVAKTVISRLPRSRAVSKGDMADRHKDGQSPWT